MVMGLAGLAVTQPLLDLMGQNPEFFVAGRYSPSQIILFGLVVALVPSIVLVVLLAGADRLRRRAARVVTLVVLGALGATFGAVLARGAGLDSLVGVGLLALIGMVAVLVLVGWQPGRLLLQYLAVANVGFLVLFLVASPTSRLISQEGRDGELGRISMPEPPGPVVFVLFDELPVSTLMELDGTVNEERFPAFARVEATSTWYRNTSSTHHRTEIAVPDLMTGGSRPRGALPTHRDLPRNLFTMLGAEVPVERYEPITDLCPPSICDPRPGQSLDQALRDAMVVYGHRALPAGLRGDLPPIDEGWGGFGAGIGGGGGVEEQKDAFGPGGVKPWKAKGEAEQSPAGQAQKLSEAEIAGSEPGLHFFHVVLPHAPWILSPWGPMAMEDAPGRVRDPADPAHEWYDRIYYQRHLLQAGVADAALGQLLDRLERSPEWKDTTLVITADHGVSTLGPNFGRTPTPRNVQEVLRVPLFIKAPGQAKGAVVDDPALSIDIVPTLADLLDVELEWSFKGHSLIDGSRGTATSKVGDDIAPLFDVVRRHAEQVPEGDWVDMAAIGEHGDLVGRRLDSFQIGPPSDLTWEPNFEDEFDSLPTADGRAPQVMRGALTTPGDVRPPPLVVSVNGTIGATLGGYIDSRDRGWLFTTVLGPFLRAGANEIQAYEVDGEVLRPLG